MFRKVIIFGSTGSIGKQSLSVIKHLNDVYGKGSFSVVGLAAKSNVDVLVEQIDEFRPEIVAVYEEEACSKLRSMRPRSQIVGGLDGLKLMAGWSNADFVIMGMSGFCGIELIVEVIKSESRKVIGIANKEILVAAGEYIMELASSYGVTLIPIDSEHSAIFQCLQGESIKDVKRLILTASGGPFLHHSHEKLSQIVPCDALRHPTWEMGKHVSINCSTLMNKGLEVIEARWLFGIETEKIDVLIHPQSQVHSLVEFVDGSIKALLSCPTMEIPLQYALTFPERGSRQKSGPIMDFSTACKLEFSPPDMNRFKCLALAYNSMKMGGTMPCFMCAANEVLVGQFLEKKIQWLEIPKRLECLMQKHSVSYEYNMNNILKTIGEARSLSSL